MSFQWEHLPTGEILTNEGEQPEGLYGPVYDDSRVRGDTYTPYQGSTDWEQSANHAMSEQAHTNYERSQRRS